MGNLEIKRILTNKKQAVTALLRDVVRGINILLLFLSSRPAG
jgi:hypothetical protein